MDIKNIVLFVREESKELYSLVDKESVLIDDVDITQSFFELIESIDDKYSGFSKAVYQITYDQHLDEPRLLIDYLDGMDIINVSTLSSTLYDDLQSIKENIEAI